jgi:dipeptidyl aminopeptidase/acylaminoacyl peptidase
MLFFFTLAITLFSLTAHSADTPFSLQDTLNIRQVSLAIMSPNGQNIAYTISKPRTPGVDNAGRDWREIYLVDNKGRTRPYVSGHKTTAMVTWSADSQFIWFLAKDDLDASVSIYVMPVAGGEARRLISHSTDIDGYALSNDGNKLLYWAKESKNPQQLLAIKKGFSAHIYEEDQPTNTLWLVDFKQQDPIAKPIYKHRHVVNAQFFPDSQSLLLTSTPTAAVDDVISHKQLSVADINGKVINRIQHVGKMGKASISPDGQHIAFIGTNDIHDPAEGRMIVASSKGSEVRHLLPNFKGQVRDLLWLSNNKIGFIAHQQVESFWASKYIEDDSDAYKKLYEDGGILESASASSNGKNIAWVSHRPDHPKEVYWYNGRRANRMTDSNPWLDDKELAKQEVIEYRSRDGQLIQGLLIHPLKKPEKSAALLIFVHGGPEYHLSNGWLDKYSSPVQYAAAQGYLSFLPNYRGSTGRGVLFSKLGQKDYAGAEFNDLVDGKKHLVSLGLADTNKTGISGVSYGGYAAAWAATALSEHFAAAVTLSGIGDQISKFGTTDIPSEMYNQHALSWPWENWQWLLERSPIYYAQQSKTPILIAHGADDERVHVSQSMELYRYLKLNGKIPVRLVIYPDESHGIKAGAAKLDYAMRLMRWMDTFVKQGKTDIPTYELALPLAVDQ